MFSEIVDQPLQVDSMRGGCCQGHPGQPKKADLRFLDRSILAHAITCQLTALFFCCPLFVGGCLWNHLDVVIAF